MIEKYPFLEQVIARFQRKESPYRFLLGIVGAPASGKSTLAELLPPIINSEMGVEVATHFNMDGYHRFNAALKERAIFPYKGSHFTFDVEGFMAKLVEIKEADRTVKCPIYDRKVKDPTPDAHTILRGHRMVVVEGNYLLLDIHPWRAIRHLLDFCIYLEVEENIQIQRLLKRHIKGGKSRAQAMDKVKITDLPNAALIERDRHRADVVYRPPGNFS